MSVEDSNKYEEPVDVRERTRFFDGQFLVDYDFIRDQVYHIDRQRNHNKTLHISGIANGLQVSGGANYQVTVTAGTAIDQNGRQIVLAADCTLDTQKLGLVDGATGSTIYLHLAYNQAPATYPQTDQQGLKGQPRWVELPCLFCYISASGDPLRAGDNYPAVNNWPVAAAYCAQQQGGVGLSDNAADWQWEVWSAVAPPPLLLAKLTIDASGNVTVEDKRTYAGLRLPGPDEIFLRTQPDNISSTNASPGAGFWLAQSGSEPTLRLSLANDGSVGIGTAVTASALDIRTNQASLLRLENSLGNGSEVHIDLATYGPGTAPPLDPSARISAIDDINFSNHIAFLTKQPGNNGQNKLTERLRFTSDGKVGIGTDKPVEKLTISGGNIQIDSGQQLLFTNGDISNNLKVQLWTGYGLGINGSTLFYAADGRHSWRDASGANERMALTTGADGGLTVSGTGYSSFAGRLVIGTQTIGTPQTTGDHHLQIGYRNAQIHLGDESNWGQINRWDNRLQMRSPDLVTIAVGGDNGHDVVTVANDSLALNGVLTVSGTGQSSIAGKLGIGTISPASPLSVNGGIAIGANYASSSTAPINGLIVQGNVGIGTTLPAALLDINGTLKVTKVGIRTDSPTIDLAIGDNDTGLHQQGDGQLAIYTNNVERVRVDANGNVGIGTSSPDSSLQVSGNIHTTGSLWVDSEIFWGAPGWDNGDKGGNTYLQINCDDYPGAGGCWHGMCVSQTSSTPSDLYLKKDIQAVDQALSKLNQLSGITYHWNEEGIAYASKNIQQTMNAGPQASEAENQALWDHERAKIRATLAARQLGLIAQDVEKVTPEAVFTDDDGYKRVDYPRLTALLVEAIKELAHEVEVLKARA